MPGTLIHQARDLLPGHSGFALTGWGAFVVIGLLLSVIDLREMRLPDRWVAALVAAGASALALDAASSDSWDDYRRGVTAAVALAAFYYAIRVLSRGGMGLGDVKLAAPVGLYLGYEGWGHVAVGTFLGFLFGAAVGVALMALQRAGRKTALPFGPFMMLGAWSAPLLTGPVVALVIPGWMGP